ncbi:MAG TPA: elongation factor P maturation arginine rhamnosyltransferase EarP [Plasticicumulans sp.]|nr:elongation factor P maturation arginine rhamnosyltransferase EarP [Plasticicumulans sp.]
MQPILPSPALRWDLWCHVIDNYGDAGVCWRLARRLVAVHGQRVRLWIDAPAVLARLWPAIDAQAAHQVVAGVEIRHWRESLEAAECADAGDVVVEAFACELPAPARAALQARRSLWLNLEYLSAEAWVEGCHGLGSAQPGGRTRYFFFPGFTPATGGLIGADAACAQWDERAARASLAAQGVTGPAAARRLSLFTYGNAALPGWLEALAAGDEPWLALVPDGRTLRALGDWLGAPLAPGETRTRAALSIHALPFLAQDDYDRLLWSSHLNVVRGEDSFVRAHWARRPLLWQAYRQDGEAHLDKLEAWLARALDGLEAGAAGAARAAHRAWNREADFAAHWPALRAALPALEVQAGRFAGRLAEGPELAAALVAFAQSKIE